MQLKDPKIQARLCLISILLGVVETGVAKVLLLAINFFTNLFYSQKISLKDGTIDISHLGLLSIFVPVIGGLIVGLIARFGSAGIRGHGIPEAMEKILIGKSR